MGVTKAVGIRKAQADEAVREKAKRAAREMFWLSLPFLWLTLLMAGCLAHALYPLSLDELVLLACAGAVSSLVPPALEYGSVMKRAKEVK